MPRCEIQPGVSPTFKRLVKSFERECPHVLDDLEDVFARIELDFRHAANAHAQTEYGGRIWKYECNSRDYKRGARGAFRIIAHYDETTNTLYPILLYFKPHLAKPENEFIDKALREIIDILATGQIEGRAGRVYLNRNFGLISGTSVWFMPPRSAVAS